MNASRILLLAAVIFGVLFGSVFLGMAVGTSDFESLGAFVIIAAAIATFALLREKIWILIPIFAAWEGRIHLLPLPLSVANVAVAFAVACSVLLVFSRSTRLLFKLDLLDFWIVCMLVILALGYVRNPVGVAALASGGDIGARPYFEIVMAMFAYVILANKSAPVTLLRQLPIYIIIGNVIIAIGGSIAFFVPEVGLYMFQFYSGFMPDVSALNSVQEADPGGKIGRAGFVLGLASALGLYLFARQPPPLSLSPLRPVSAFALMLTGLLALISGFRGAIGALGMQFIIGSYLWWGLRGLLLCAAMALLGIGGIAAIQSSIGLPDRIQRPLSFLPGPWDSQVLQSTKASNEWRFDMWEHILFGDSIKNRWIGDGFGFPASEFAFYSELYRTEKISSEQLADYFLITGDLHSGPLSTLKFVGGIGLFLFITLSFYIAVRYARLWHRIRHTPLGMPVAFHAIAAIYFPIKFIFIFGAFQQEMAYLIITAGLLRMLELSARDYEANLALEAPAPQPSAPQKPVANPRRRERLQKPYSI